jgi:hypothetical protein
VSSIAALIRYRDLCLSVSELSLTFIASSKIARSIKPQDYLDAACDTVCPLQPACGHLQVMSGVFSIASHSVLQYVPDVTLQEQTGWAHFLLSSDGMWSLLLLHQTVGLDVCQARKGGIADAYIFARRRTYPRKNGRFERIYEVF